MPLRAIPLAQRHFCDPHHLKSIALAFDEETLATKSLV
jgi:hypothetical protein